MKQVHVHLGELMRHEHCPLSVAQQCSGVTAHSAVVFGPAELTATAVISSRIASGDRTRAREGVSLLHAEERTNYPLMLSVDDLGAGFRLTVQVEASIGAEACMRVHAPCAGIADGGS